MSLSLIKFLRAAGVFAVLAMLILSMADPLVANENESWRYQHRHRHREHRGQQGCGYSSNDNNNSVPEITLGEAGAASVLLIGSVLILTDRVRRRRFVLKSD